MTSALSRCVFAALTALFFSVAGSAADPGPNEVTLTGAVENPLHMTAGSLRVTEMVFQLPEGAKSPKAAVVIAGRAARASVDVSGRDAVIRLESPAVVEAGGAIEVTLTS